MDTNNVQLVELPCVNKNNGQEFCGCTRRILALISSWILLLVHGALFGWVICSMFYKIASDQRLAKYKEKSAVIWVSSDKEVQIDDSYFGFSAETLFINTYLFVAFLFNIILLIGVEKKKTNFILAWIIFFMTSSLIILYSMITSSESFTSFQQKLVIKLVILCFLIFLSILSYYKQLRDLEAGISNDNLRKVQVTVVDPMQPHLPTHPQTQYQPYLQNQWPQQYSNPHGHTFA